MTDVNEQIPSYFFSFLHAFFFLGVKLCYFSFFFFLFTPFFSFFLSFGVALFFFFFSFRCWTFLLFHYDGCRICPSCFWPLFLVSYFLGALCFLSLSLDRLNKPLQKRFLIVLSRFSDRQHIRLFGKWVKWTSNVHYD